MDRKRQEELDDLGAMIKLVGTNLNEVDKSFTDGGHNCTAKNLNPKELLMRELKENHQAQDAASQLITADSVMDGSAPMSFDSVALPPEELEAMQNYPPTRPGYTPQQGGSQGFGPPATHVPEVKPIFTKIAGVEVKIVGDQVFTKEWRDLSEVDMENYRVDRGTGVIQKNDWYPSEVQSDEDMHEEEPEEIE